MRVGRELGTVLVEGTFVLATTVTTPSDERDSPLVIADIATMMNIRERSILVHRCFHRGRGGLIGSSM